MGLTTTLPKEEVNHETFRDNLTANQGGNPEPQQQRQTQDAPKPKLEEYNVSQMNQENPSLLTLEWDKDDKAPYEDIIGGKTETKTVPPPIGNTPPSNIPGTPSFVPYNKEKYRTGVKVVILIIDFLMSNLLKFIAKARNAGNYTADKAQKDILEDSILELMDDSKVKLPPWVVCLFAFLGAYAIQAFAAFGDRKKNEEDQVRIENLERANEAIRKKNEENKATKATPPVNTNTTQNTTPTSNTPQSSASPVVPPANVGASQDVIQDTPIPEGPGKYWKDGVEWRKYKNGKSRRTKYHPITKEELIVGQPARRNTL